MQNEDDLRGLAKVTDFMRAISFLFLAIHIYWFCYGWLHEMGWTLDIVDRILSNFQRTTGLFSSLLYTKLFCVLFLGLSGVVCGLERRRSAWVLHRISVWRTLYMVCRGGSRHYR
jgi:hypothetical protein